MGQSDSSSYIVRTQTDFVEPTKVTVFDAQYTPQTGIMTVLLLRHMDYHLETLYKLKLDH